MLAACSDSAAFFLPELWPYAWKVSPEVTATSHDNGPITMASVSKHSNEHLCSNIFHILVYVT